MDTEVTVVGIEAEEKREGCTESACVELGVVSEDTQGSWLGWANDSGLLFIRFS